MLEEILKSLLYVSTFEGLAWNLLGTALGVAVGAVPGLGGGLAMALVLPLTFTMSPVDAQIFLLGIYVGGVGGSLISAILVGVPGSPAAIMTTLDGFALARKGKVALALSVGVSASFIGGIVSWVILLTLSVPLARVAMKLQSIDYFLLVMMGLILIGVAGDGSLIRALIAGLVGILFSTVGIDAVSASQRFTFGVPALSNGLDLLAVLIGAFAVQQIVEDVGKQAQPSNVNRTRVGEILRYLTHALSHYTTLIRSSLIGTGVGILPGLGANIAAVVSYTLSKTVSGKRANYGKGEPEAIVAAETANNASVGGALVPMISLGIPGSGQDVILMAALILHQIQPGPLLVNQNPEVFFGLITAYLIANCFMFVIMVLAIKPFEIIARIPTSIFAPIVLVFCVLGVLSANNRIQDLWVMLGTGLFAFAMRRFGFPIVPFVIGFVLGPLAEERLRSALMSSNGEILSLLSRPVSLFLLLVCIAAIVWPSAKSLLRRATNRAG